MPPMPQIGMSTVWTIVATEASPIGLIYSPEMPPYVDSVGLASSISTPSMPLTVLIALTPEPPAAFTALATFEIFVVFCESFTRTGSFTAETTSFVIS